MKTNLILTIVVVLLLSSCYENREESEEKMCIINGELSYELECDSLVLFFDPFENILISENYKVIRVKDGKFYDTIYFKESKAIELIVLDELYSGSWFEYIFFTEEGILNMQFNERESDAPVFEVEGLHLSSFYNETKYILSKWKKESFGTLLKQRDSLIDNDLYYSSAHEIAIEKLEKLDSEDEARYALFDELESLRISGQNRSDALIAVHNSMIEPERAVYNRYYNYLKEQVNAASFYLILKEFYNLSQSKKDGDYDFDEKRFLNLLEITNYFCNQMPNHSYATIAKEMMASAVNLSIGQSLIDFTLPDTNGVVYTLSEMIKGKYAIVDIWAPWCGPCLNKADKIKPIYEKYKDKGFTVVGVASHYKSMESVTNTLINCQHPWITLIDSGLNSTIRKQYGIPNAGGGSYLIDPDGKLLLLNPTVEEVEAILETK